MKKPFFCAIFAFFLAFSAKIFALPSPIPASPLEILEYDQKLWRESEAEAFLWKDFPEIIILDTENYDVQDKFLKRLAFFVEKKGFRGRLAPDSEIADLHAWNAHDYRASDLAAFFSLASSRNFPLNAEERSLEKLLLDAGVISAAPPAQNGRYRQGRGALLSISRESPEYLRRRFMAHEGFHGLFFIDADFRAFSAQRWKTLAPAPKRALLAFFGFQQYDTDDQYLVVNEFQAHVLQQSVGAAPAYFGRTLPLRVLESAWRQKSLPPKDEKTDSWPDLAAAFTDEAAAFSDYVGKRWGLAAGRVWREHGE